jgi:hypothetical protein
MKVLVAIILVAAVVANVHAPKPKYSPQLLSEFNAWQIKYNRVYQTVPEFEHALMNFQASIARVAKNNKRTGGKYYGLTKFADLSPAEFKAKFLKSGGGRGRSADSVQADVLPPSTHAAPATFDWRNSAKPVVSPVKDQGQCGSCWAFSATENIESMWALKHGSLPILGPEQIVDCDTVDQGCNGGDTPTAFEYVTQQGGLDTEASYPYTAGDSGTGGSCAYEQSSVAASISNYTWAIAECTDSCNSQSMSDVQSKLATVAPFAICVYAEPWQDYSSGIFDDTTCSHDYSSLDHCVQLVGYDNNQGFWIVRNSWNTDWGEQGYIRVSTKVAKGNLCGIMDEVNFANAD